ncbi:MAG: carbohydrate porin [Alphaproteobacteria bacterium]
MFDDLTGAAMMVAAALVVAAPAAAQSPQTPQDPPAADRTPEAFAIHAQSTAIVQGLPAFRARYTGQNSLYPNGLARQSTSITGFFSVRLPWEGGELHVNPEFFQGFGIGNTLGIAGFVNGDAQKAGSNAGVFYLARGYIRQTFALGADREWQEGAANQLAGFIPTQRVTISVGRFAGVDFFQTSAYAGDSRRQFMNWSIWGPTSSDLAANIRGYVEGAVVEVTPFAGTTFRYGALLMPTQPNGSNLALKLNNISHVFEIAHQHNWFGRPGAIKPYFFYTNGTMGRFNQALSLAATGLDPDDAIATTRRFGNVKWGFGLLVDQELTDHIGVFARMGWNDGKTESYAFTQVDRAFAAGISVKGDLWRMPGHTFGLAVVQNNLSGAHSRFLAAGGTGIILGDGALNYGSERIIETYYDLPVYKDNVFLAANYQFISNPGYNRDRGPAHVFGMRLHARY